VEIKGEGVSNLITEQVFKDHIIATINSYIRMINESDKSDVIGKGVINNYWVSYIEDLDNTFVAVLTINGKREEFRFIKEEWFGFNINMFENKKLQNLFNQLTKI
jgi:hypothetical protein